MREKQPQRCKACPLSKSPCVRRSKQEMEIIIGEIRTGSLSIWSACKKHGINWNTLTLWKMLLRVGSLTDKTYTTISTGIRPTKLKWILAMYNS